MKDLLLMEDRELSEEDKFQKQGLLYKIIKSNYKKSKFIINMLEHKTWNVYEGNNPFILNENSEWRKIINDMKLVELINEKFKNDENYLGFQYMINCDDDFMGVVAVKIPFETYFNKLEKKSL